MESKKNLMLKALVFIALAAMAAFLTKLSFSTEIKTAAVREDTSSPSSLGKYGLAQGSIPPDFTIGDIEGNKITLSDFAKQKKPVLVYFMATWCPYCREDYEELSKAYPEYEGKITILSIDLDASEDANQLAEYRKNYPKLQKMIMAAAKSSVLADYRVTKTTEKYGISRDGRIAYAGFGTLSEEEWRKLLDLIIKA